jgi:spermidine/putrescine transport system permease protein
MIRADRVLRAVIGVYLVLFFAYLLLPLLYMIAAAFNTSRFPMLTPWRGFTLQWFAAAWNEARLWHALGRSILIGACVIVVSIVLGLGGALLFTRFRPPVRSLLYSILVSPILMPGIVIGLSTAIFWDRLLQLPGSWVLAVLGQSAFISAYCMLIFMSRLQRFDRALEEAAFDLGASPVQVFRTVTLPYLRPAMYSAAALAFMQSFDNFNTTLFTIGSDETLTIYIAAKLKRGVTPAVNALACAMVAATLGGGVAYELVRRREAARIARRHQEAGT